MTDLLAHRGPDGKGYWLNSSGNIGFGHRRLSIIDLSNDGSQPMHYFNERYTITYNGEIYNYLEIKNRLIAKSYHFTTKTDTEVILAAYHHWGKECLKEFDGMFAFAIWDKKNEELFCARDRFGEKPFFYYKDGEQFVFASEMKSIWNYTESKTPNTERIYKYLLYGLIEDPNNEESTFFKNIYQIPPAHYLYIKNKKIRTVKYWYANYDINTDISFEEACLKFKEMFFKSIEFRLRSDVKVGSSLSGGLDSSSIVCSINKVFNVSEFNTFSAVFPGFKNDESEFIKEVIEQTHFNAHYIKPDADSFIRNFDDIMWHQEEPIGNASLIAQYEVIQKSKSANTPVLIDGQGADEILAGYPTFYNAHHTYNLNKSFFHGVKLINEYSTLYNFTPFKEFLAASKFYLQHSSYSYILKNIRKNMLPTNSPFFHGIHPNLIKEFQSIKAPKKAQKSLKNHTDFFLSKRGLRELLRYGDRNSMAHSVEIRTPFLNHKLIEFINTLPEKYIMQGGWTKYIMRKSMDGIIPQKIQWRKNKIGYEAPQKDWMNDIKVKKRLSRSIEYLKDNKIIINDESSLHWKYLMLGTIYENNKG